MDLKKYLRYLLVLGLCGTGKTLASNDRVPSNFPNVGIEQSSVSGELNNDTKLSDVSPTISIKQSDVSSQSSNKSESDDKNVLKKFFDNCGQYSPEEISKISLEVKSKSGGEDGKASYIVEVSGLDEFKKMSNDLPLAFKIDRDLKLGDCKDDKIGFDYDFNLTFDGKTKEDFEVFCRVIKSNKVFDFLFSDVLGSASGGSSLDSKLLKKFSNMLMSGGDKHLEVNFSNVNWPKIDLNINDKITIGKIDDNLPTSETKDERKLVNEKTDDSKFKDKKKINEPREIEDDKKDALSSEKGLDAESKDKLPTDDQKVDDSKKVESEKAPFLDSDENLDKEKKEDSSDSKDNQKADEKRVDGVQKDESEDGKKQEAEKKDEDSTKAQEVGKAYEKEEGAPQKIEEVQKEQEAKKKDEDSTEARDTDKADEKKESVSQEVKEEKKEQEVERKDEASAEVQDTDKADEKKESTSQKVKEEKKEQEVERKDEISAEVQGTDKADEKKESTSQEVKEEKKEQEVERKDDASTEVAKDSDKTQAVAEVEDWERNLSSRQLSNPEVVKRVKIIKKILDKRYPVDKCKPGVRDFAATLLLNMVWGNLESDNGDSVKHTESISPGQSLR